MTDRDRLIELLQKESWDYLLCKANIELLADYLIANGVTVNEWISVEERLPNSELAEFKTSDWDLYPCLVTIKNKRAEGGRYVGKAWYDGERFLEVNCTDITYDVTHWMPLPEPPKGVDNG